MSDYNGWKNWATWACTLHFDFGEIVQEMFDARTKSDDYDDFVYSCADYCRNFVEEIVTEARDSSTSDDEPPVMELYNHTQEIDFMEIVEAMLYDMDIVAIEGKVLGGDLVSDGAMRENDKEEIIAFLMGELDFAMEGGASGGVEEQLEAAWDAMTGNRLVLVDDDGVELLDVTIAHPAKDTQPEAPRP